MMRIQPKIEVSNSSSLVWKAAGVNTLLGKSHSSRMYPNHAWTVGISQYHSRMITMTMCNALSIHSNQLPNIASFGT